MYLFLILAHAAPAEEWSAVDGANLQRPVWSADGSQIAYEANFHDKKEIELYAGSPGSFRRVTPMQRSSSSLTAGFSKPSNGAVAHEVSWGPATIGRFVYSASGDAQDYDLYISGGGPVAAGPGADGGPAWSPDGAYIAFTSARTGQGDIYLLTVAEIEAPPRQLSTTADAAELDVVWSPDSIHLAWVGHTSSGDNLWEYDVRVGTSRPITDWSGSQTRPRFGPDGTLGFYSNKNDADRWDLYVRVDNEIRMILEDVVPNARGPMFTPDGASVIAVKNDDDRFDPIVRVDVATGASETLDLGTVGHGDLDVVERDGAAWIAYVAQGRDANEDRTFKRLFAAPLPE